MHFEGYILTDTASIKTRGNTSSMAPMSLLNLLSTLPLGFVSKNLIGAVNKQLNMFLWMFLDALMAIL